MEIEICSVLTEDIVFDEIVPKLSVTSLMQLRCVSKSWSFVLFRLVVENLFPSNDLSSDELIVKFVDEKIFPEWKRGNSFFTLSYDNLNLTRSFIHDCRTTKPGCRINRRFIGSINGIVFSFSTILFGKGFRMWNPTTNTYQVATNCITPHPNSYSSPFLYDFGLESFGCGFCAQSQDIKVVSIRPYYWYPRDDPEEESVRDEEEQERDFLDADDDNCDENVRFSDARDDFLDEGNDANSSECACGENEQEHDFSDANDDFVDEGNHANISERTTRAALVRDFNLRPDYIVEVYSLSTESWKQVVVDAQLFSQFPSIMSRFYPQQGYTNNDTYSWLVITHDVGDPPIVKLLTFHMNTEVFQVTPVPDAVFGDSDYYSNFGLFPFQLLNGTIVLVIPSLDRTSFEIWLLLEYGVADSWTRLCTIGPFPEIHLILGFWKNGKVFMESTSGELLLADLFTNKIIQNLQIEGCPGFSQIIPSKITRIVLKGDRWRP